MEHTNHITNKHPDQVEIVAFRLLRDDADPELVALCNARVSEFTIYCIQLRQPHPASDPYVTLPVYIDPKGRRWPALAAPGLVKKIQAAALKIWRDLSRPLPVGGGGKP